MENASKLHEEKKCPAWHDEDGATKNIHWVLKGMLQFTMLLGLVFSVMTKDWLNTFVICGIMILTIIPSVLGKQFSVRIPKEFEMLSIVFIFLTLFLGEMHKFYLRFWWWDLLMHASSAVLLGILAFLLVYVLNQQPHVQLHLKPGFVALFAFTFAVAMGTVWELFEFAMDTIFGLNMQKSGLVDTMSDLAVDVVAALVVSVTGYVYMLKGMRSVVEEWIVRFVHANPRLFTQH